jgi:hypothetical protein
LTGSNPSRQEHSKGPGTVAYFLKIPGLFCFVTFRSGGNLVKHLSLYVNPSTIKAAFIILTLVLLAMSIGAPNSIGWPGSVR